MVIKSKTGQIIVAPYPPDGVKVQDYTVDAEGTSVPEEVGEALLLAYPDTFEEV